MMTFQNLISLRTTRPLAALVSVGLCFVLLGYQTQASQPLSAEFAEYQAPSLSTDASAQDVPTYLPGMELFHGGNASFKGAQVRPYL